MVKRKIPAKTQGVPQVSPDRGVELLLTQILKGRRLLDSRPLSKDSYSTWELLTKNYLEKAFGENTDNVKNIMGVGKTGSYPMGAPEEFWENRRAENLQTQLERLDGLVELLRTEFSLDIGSERKSSNIGVGNRIFVVHGKNEKAVIESARFMEKLGLEAIILREQPNKGRTIIEKFEDYSDVGFAVVILSADDKGGPIDSPYEEQKPRSRQNVLFELGYFIGKLGRGRVCALYEEGVEIPSDYSGVLYVPMDSNGAWKLELAKEMKAAGLAVDMNLAI